eukprot:NODE_21691_length_251_cov_2.633663_g20522_i0.p1 GENE.NODE_21691_length_251_cov_2.633663_g20522_i0~~NODE_21691_length_251_cov_2.633663_g20522_i0.p1  ORF type:complete len:67 (-),score=6.08 NODE_21691_length_251_cov_2.633663_g20522_i0:16-216(-)
MHTHASAGALKAPADPHGLPEGGQEPPGQLTLARPCQAKAWQPAYLAFGQGLQAVKRGWFRPVFKP